MKTLRLPLLAALAALVFTGCQTTTTTRSASPGAEDAIVRLSSASPVTFSGSVNVDGKLSFISGTTPAEYTFHAEKVECDIRKGPEPGELKIEVYFPKTGRTVNLTPASR